jgi:type I restriction enzyme S subunit
MTRRYPSYRDSGVEWLGEVPEHWDIGRIKNSVKDSKNGVWGDEPIEDDLNAVVCVRVADFDRDGLRVNLTNRTLRSVSPSERQGRLLERGDLLLEKSGGGEFQLVGAVVLFDAPDVAVCSNFVAKVTLKPDMHPSFWCYMHSAAYSVRLNAKSVKQTSGIQNLDQAAYFDEQAPFPPLPEQTAIAAFLDQETAKIDALVAEQRRLIDLLREKRQAVISHAVTKGLNPNATLKPSGIEWLGDVPEGWEAWKLTHAFEKIGSGTTPKTDIREYYDGGTYPWLNTGDLNDADLNDCEKKITTRALNDHTTLRIYPAGSVVIAMYGATIGKLAILNFSASVNQACCVFSGQRKIDYKFLFFWLLGYRPQIINLASGGGQPNINQEILRGLRVPCPDLSEQVAIARFLENETAKFDNLTAEAQRAIDLLQERRTALISAAVTGQIDVRPQTRN